MGVTRARAMMTVLLAVLLACGARTGLDVGALGPIGAAVGLRLVAPLSTATVTTQRPTLRWILGAGKDGAQIDICRNRACTGDVTTFDALGTHATPPATLTAGVYFWRARSTSGGHVGTVSSPVWEFWVGARSTPVDTSWGTTLDVNGDGLPDLAIGAPDAVTNLGRAYVYLNTGAGFATTPTTTLTGQVLPEAPAQGFFGTSVASAGDLNGDGFGDFVVGAMSDGTNDPLVYVFLGGPSGITSPPMIIADHLEGGYASSVAAAGDVNGDGFGDLIVGEMTDFMTSVMAYVYFGSADGLSASSATMLLGPVAPGAVDGPIVASAGDLNGDGFDDVFVGADYFLNTGGGNSFLYLGGAHGPSATPLATLTGPGGTNMIYGFTPPQAVDLDGDGFADLVLRGTTDGTAYVYPGGANGFTSTPTTILQSINAQNDGWAVSLGSGDIDGDGFDDLIVGSNGESGGDGAMYVYPGGANGVAAVPSTRIAAPDSLGFFGSAVVNAGDVDGDGHVDVVVGAFRVSEDVGRAYLYAGGSSGLAPTPTMTFLAPDGGRFGSSVF